MSGAIFTEEDALAGRIEFDHRPPLSERPIKRYEIVVGLGKLCRYEYDFDPPQHDPDHIFAVLKGEHDAVTNGPGGERRITTRGSDTGERARGKGLAESHVAHQTYMANKAPGQKRPKSSNWPKKWTPKR